MGIPDDVKAAAESALEDFDTAMFSGGPHLHYKAVGVFARAILAERQRCADVARSMAPPAQFDEYGDEVSWDEESNGARLALLEAADSIMRGGGDGS